MTNTQCYGKAQFMVRVIKIAIATNSVCLLLHIDIRSYEWQNDELWSSMFNVNESEYKINKLIKYAITYN